MVSDVVRDGTSSVANTTMVPSAVPITTRYIWSAPDNLVISLTQREIVMPKRIPQWAVWPLSGSSVSQEAFQQNFLPSYSILEEQDCIDTRVSLGIAGVVKGVEILLQDRFVKDVANFLTELFQQEYQYRSLNAYCLAISSAHEKVDGEPVGQQLLVSCLLEGSLNERPRYQAILDVGYVQERCTTR